MAMIKPECGGCQHHLKLTDGCLRIGHGMVCSYAPLPAADWKGDVDEPHAPTKEELADVFRANIEEKNALTQATANAMLQSAFEKQVGGSHYKSFAIQPAEFIQRNGIGFLEGCVIKRMCRWESKDGLRDLRKAIHEIELLIEMQEKATPSP